MNISHHKYTRMFSRIAGVAVMASLFIVSGCVNDECFENKNSLPLAGFYSSDEKPKAITLGYISIYGIGSPGDSILHDSIAGLSQSYLPFRIDEGNTRYVIRYFSGIPEGVNVADTITFNYEIIPWFVSSACGAVYNYDMTSITTTHHIIDSVTCPQGVIDNKNAENLKIYFRVNTES